MKIGQIRWDGQITAAVFDERGVLPIPEHSLLELIERCEREHVNLAALVAAHSVRVHAEVSPIIPVHPREVWACGSTYELPASVLEAPDGTRESFSRLASYGPRPEIFFKGTSRVCVGPGKPIGIRADSEWTVPEPELALLLGPAGRVLGYTLANDVSARDISRENPLYAPQSKFYKGCCALGPWWVTPDALTDPYAIDIRCQVLREGSVLFEGSVSTAKLGRKIETLIEYLLRSNPVPAGSVLLTGTGVFLPRESALREGDTVEISSPQIGTLSNPAARV